MKKTGIQWMVAAALGLGLTARAEPVPFDPEEVGESVAVMCADALGMLGKEKIHSQFDMLRQLKDFGVSYQPDLVVPLDLASRLDEEGKRRFAGMKLFDAIYAATFMKRKELADCLDTIEAVETALDLRSHADLSGSFFKTFKKAAAEPESIDIQVLLDQLANDYVHEVPAMLSSEATANYLIEGLYGFTLQMSSVLEYFSRPAHNELLRNRIRKHTDTNWLYAMLDIFDSFNRSKKDVREVAEAEERLAVIRKMVSAIEADRAGELTPEEGDRLWADISIKINTIRASFLTPR